MAVGRLERRSFKFVGVMRPLFIILASANIEVQQECTGIGRMSSISVFFAPWCESAYCRPKGVQKKRTRYALDTVRLPWQAPSSACDATQRMWLGKSGSSVIFARRTRSLQDVGLPCFPGLEGLGWHVLHCYATSVSNQVQKANTGVSRMS